MLTFEKFLTEAKWTPEGGLDSWSNYSGPDLTHLLRGPSRSRDSGVLAESNFAAALQMLRGESETVTVERFGHWACGWYEVILVDPRDTKAAQTLFEIHKSLQDYPVLDEGDFYERESEEQNETFVSNQDEFEKTVFEVLFGDESDFDFDEYLAVTSDRDFAEFTRFVFDEDCGYQGQESAWVTEESVLRAASCRYSNMEENSVYKYARTVLGLDKEQGA